MRKAALLFVLASAAAVALWSLWRSASSDAAASALTPAATETRQASDAPREALVGERGTGRAVAERPAAEVAPEPTPGPPPSAAPEPATSADEAPALHAIELAYVLPTRGEVTLRDVHLQFLDETGRGCAFFQHGLAQRIQVELPAGRYRLTAEADDHRFVPDTREVRDDGSIQPDHRLTFWPERWIPVVVRTQDGRSFQALAEDLGLHPKRFFDGAFAVRVSRSPFTDDGTAVPEHERLATFRPAPGYQVTAIGDDVAGSLELAVDPPLWVGLWIHGSFYNARVLDPGAEAVVFTLDLPALDARFATVRARVVDLLSGAPADDATATIKAERSAHRRADLADRRVDADGRVVFERVMPGDQELVVARGANLAQRQLRLSAGQDLDLGDIPLGTGPGIRVRALDAEGRPGEAFVELAPYRRGARSAELYHPNLWRRTSADGTYELPVPDRPSIVRCRRILGRGHTEVATRNVLVDPEHPPAEIVVTLEEAHEVGFLPRVPWEEGYQMTLEDELGVLVATHLSRREAALIVPGRYVVRLWDGERELRSEAVEVTARAETIDAP